MRYALYPYDSICICVYVYMYANAKKDECYSNSIRQTPTTGTFPTAHRSTIMQLVGPAVLLSHHAQHAPLVLPLREHHLTAFCALIALDAVGRLGRRQWLLTRIMLIMPSLPPVVSALRLHEHEQHNAGSWHDDA
jgi:hypothetical protein